ncbi:hypothetical protein BDA99DRAFT_557692 [Phascolomyces articulosus]|uniref:Uncharacterized protein n=1 Tax=Phascolomyces articulosus TaxID=60185 RepID=A0AAD5PG21_9FUNG|nr:hypothetical protein BDA99DRAFT_557692 [Phascolomyces articulosus]
MSTEDCHTAGKDQLYYTSIYDKYERKSIPSNDIEDKSTYDKLCFHKLNKQDKRRHFKELYFVYGNAVIWLPWLPELKIQDPLDFERSNMPRCGADTRYTGFYQANQSLLWWWKCAWALKEVMLSKRILIVRSDMNLFQYNRLTVSHVSTTLDNLSQYLLDFNSHPRKSINQVLCECHFRMMSEPQNNIFAFANTFPHLLVNFMDNTNDDKKEKVCKIQKKRVNEFYRHIATTDISLLLFSSNQHAGSRMSKEDIMCSYDLPSRTSVDGRHLVDYIEAICAEEFQLLSHSFDDGYTLLLRFNPKKMSLPYPLNPKTTPSFTKSNRTWRTLSMNGNRKYKYEAFDTFLPLSFTEDCAECTFLSILFICHSLIYKPHDGILGTFDVDQEDQDRAYFLPLYKESSPASKNTIIEHGIYKVIGVVLIARVANAHEWKDSHELQEYFGKPTKSDGN